MSRGIAQLFALVVRLADYPPLVHDHGADRHFVFGQGLLGFLQRKPHVKFVHD